MQFRFSLSAFACSLALAAPTWAQTDNLIVSPSPAVFCGQPGQAISTLPLAVSTAAGSTTFVVSSVISSGEWLTADPSFATVTSEVKTGLVLGVKGGLIPFANGVYNGQVILAGVDGVRLASIPVVLQVSAAGCGPARNGLIFANSGPLTFQLPTAVSSGTLLNIFNLWPTNVTIVPVTSTNSGQKWLSTIGLNLNVVTGLGFPTPLGVSVDTSGLSPGTSQTGTLDIQATNFSFLDVPVTLNVTPAGASRFAAFPSPLAIGVPLGTGQTSAVFQLTNLGAAAVQVSLSAGANWLSVNPAGALIQPNNTVSFTGTIAGSALTRGVNKGSISVQGPSGGALTIPVIATYGIESELAVTPEALSLTGASQTFEVSSDVAVSFSTSTLSSINQPWLSVSPYYGTAAPGNPAKLTVTILPALLPAGTAVGSIVLMPSDGSAGVTLPVFVNAGADASVTAAPAQLSFTAQAGAVTPISQTLTFTAPANARYAVQTTGAWLTATRSGSVVTAQANPAGLAAGNYAGQITLINMATGAQRSVPVNLTVTVPAALSVSLNSLSLFYQQNAPVFETPTVQVTSTGGPVPFTFTAAGLNGAPVFLALNQRRLDAVQSLYRTESSGGRRASGGRLRQHGHDRFACGSGRQSNHHGYAGGNYRPAEDPGGGEFGEFSGGSGVAGRTDYDLRLGLRHGREQ